MKDYSATPLARKLGVKSEHRVVLLRPPVDFRPRLDPLPSGVRVARELPDHGDVDVVVLFCRSALELAEHLRPSMMRLRPDGGLWVAWPKKASRIGTDLDFEGVQGAGLALGVVDNKSCSIDEDFSGLRFVVRREHRSAWADGSRC